MAKISARGAKEVSRYRKEWDGEDSIINGRHGFTEILLRSDGKVLRRDVSRYQSEFTGRAQSRDSRWVIVKATKTQYESIIKNPLWVRQ